MPDTHPSLLVFLLDDKVKAVRAVYEKVDEPIPAPTPAAYGEDTKTARKLQGFLFKTLDDTLFVGQLVVVPTDTRHGFTVVKIVEIDAEPDMRTDKEVKWVVGPVDVAEYHRVREGEQSILAKVAKQKLRKEREALRETLLGAEAAEFDEMRLLLSADANVAEAEVADAEWGPGPNPSA